MSWLSTRTARNHDGLHKNGEAGEIALKHTFNQKSLGWLKAGRAPNLLKAGGRAGVADHASERPLAPAQGPHKPQRIGML